MVQHVLVARLGPSPHMLLPEEGADRMACNIYEVLWANFGSNCWSESTNIFLKLLSIHCHPHCIRNYITTWQNVVTKMRNCHFMVPGYVLALLFVKHLPDSLAFGSLRSGLGQHLENIAEADMDVFKEILTNALELEAQFHSITSCSQSRLLSSSNHNSSCNEHHSQSQNRPPRPAPGAHLPPAAVSSSAPDASTSTLTYGIPPGPGLLSDHRSGGGQGTQQSDPRHT